MNEWDGFNFNPFKAAALSAIQRIAASLRGTTTTGGFPQPPTTPPGPASLGDGLFQDR